MSEAETEQEESSVAGDEGEEVVDEVDEVTGTEGVVATHRQPLSTVNRIQRTHNHHHSPAETASLVIA